MGFIQVLQFIGWLFLAVYLVMFHVGNERQVTMPFFFSLPPVVVVIMGIGFGWLIAWLSGWQRARQLRRQNQKLRRRIAEIERSSAAIRELSATPPVNPPSRERPRWMRRGDAEPR